MNIQQHRYREGLRQFLEEQQFRFHLTFTFQREITYQGAKDKLRFWTNRTLRRLYGRNYFRRDSASTLLYVAFPEYGKGGDNFHLHALAKIDETRANIFTSVGRDEWQLVVPSGKLFVQTIGESLQDQKAVISYDTKALSAAKEFIISTEFASRN